MTKFSGGRPAAKAAGGESRAVRGIGTISRSVVRRAKHAHYARAICGALGTFTLTVALALVRGSMLGDGEVYVLATLLAVASFVAWVGSERIESRTVLRRIDERLHLGGAFLSAQESCAHSPDSSLAQLGAAKLLQRVRPNQALEAAVPHTLGFALLPLLGVLALVQTVQVLDARRSTAGRVTVEVGTVADHLGDIERMNRAALSEMQRQELAAIQQAAAAAAKDAADQFLDGDPKAGRPEPEQQEHWREQLRSVADDIDRLASTAPAGSELAEQLSDVAAEAEALAMDSGPQDAFPAEAKSGEGRFAGSEEGTGGGDSSFDTGAGSKEGEAGGGDVEGMDKAGPADLAMVDGGMVDGGGADEAALLDVPAGKGEAGASTGEGAPSGGANGQVAKAELQESASGEGRPRVGVLRPAEPVGDAVREPGGAAAPGAGGDPVEDEAEALLDRSRWWSDRDDAIVRAWLAKRAPK